jgi:predicted nucleic acid-binding protein
MPRWSPDAPLLMPRFCLDTSALLTLRDDEPDAERVAQILEAPQRCTACFITRMEVLYRVWKDEGERAGPLAYEQVNALPIDWLEATEPLLITAGQDQSNPCPLTCRCLDRRCRAPEWHHAPA